MQRETEFLKRVWFFYNLERRKMINYKYFKLTQEMKNKKISQRKLSRILGIHENSVRKKLSGTTEWTISEIDKLCDYFKKNYYELFKRG